MRRWMLVLPAVAVAAGVAAAVAFSSGGNSAAGAPSTATTTMSMPMPAASASASAKAPTTVELHRSVVHVKIMNFAFSPAHLVVSAGTKVVWTNEDSDPHTVTSVHRGFHSEALNTGKSFTLVARRPGHFPYYCTIHPFMHGMLVVRG